MRKDVKLKDQEAEPIMAFLVAIETPKPSPFLISSPWLLDIRGAGLLLEFVNRREIKLLPRHIGIPRYERIYYGGGTGRFLFESAGDAERFKNAVLQRYREETSSESVGVRILERSDSQSFLEWVRETVQLARLDKAGHIDTTRLPTNRWTRPCSSCGVEPAETRPGDRGSPGLCPACAVKHVAAEKLYSDAKPEKDGHRPLESAHNLARRYSNKFILTNLAQINELDGCTVYPARSFEDIGLVSKPTGFMGFLYANANRIGECVQGLDKVYGNEDEAKRAYRALSEIVDKAIREAAVEAVMEHVDIRTESEFDRFLPAEFIAAGGEELMLAVPAHNALDTVVHFVRTFQKKSIELQQHYLDKHDLKALFAPKGLTASAGVVLARVPYPVRNLMEVANGLVRTAKARSAALAQGLRQHKPGGEETGTLDFMVFDQAADASWTDPDRNHRESEATEESVAILTERPYTADEATWLLETIRALKAEGVTREELRPLSSAALQGSEQARSNALAVRDELHASGKLLEGSALESLLSSFSHLPFREAEDGVLRTPVSEILEIYEFIHPRD